VRVPLYAKLMCSYLLVVGLVFVPTYIYLRTVQVGELKDTLEQDMREELELLGDRLAEADPAEVESVAEQLVDLRHRRVTVIAPGGKVLADSAAAKGTMENHAGRPEVHEAFSNATGFACDDRHSSTLNQDLFYCALRFPRSGPARGVVRLAVPVAAVNLTAQRAAAFLKQVGAMAVSAAILLSLVCTLVLSRPLRRITQSARAFAAGDFGAPVEKTSDDEVGDLGRALVELGSHLRARLLGSGVDRATLQALIDELPLAVVLYDKSGAPVCVGAEARMILELEPQHEEERLRSLLELPEQADRVAQVLADGRLRDGALQVPWLPDATFTARWLSLYAADGTQRPALILLPPAGARDVGPVLAQSAEALRKAAAAVEDRTLALSLLRAAAMAEASVPLQVPQPESVRTVALGDLCQTAVAELGRLVADGGLKVEMVLADAKAPVAETNGRCRQAMRGLLAAAATAQDSPRVLRFTERSEEEGLRLSIPYSVEPWAVDSACRALRALGGDAGQSAEGEPPESWLLFPRA
jgi:HAMP domain-containing protein